MVHQWVTGQSGGYTYKGMFFVLNRKEVLTHATTWMNLENMVNEISQIKKDMKTNGIHQSPEINPHVQGQNVFDVCTKTIQWEKESFQQMMQSVVDWCNSTHMRSLAESDPQRQQVAW